MRTSKRGSLAKIAPEPPQNKVDGFKDQQIVADKANQLPTDDDAEVKRVILQLIYVNDYQSLTTLL